MWVHVASPGMREEWWLSSQATRIHSMCVLGELYGGLQRLQGLLESSGLPLVPGVGSTAVVVHGVRVGTHSAVGASYRYLYSDSQTGVKSMASSKGWGQLQVTGRCGGSCCWHALPWLLGLTTGTQQWRPVLRVGLRACSCPAGGVSCR